MDSRGAIFLDRDGVLIRDIGHLSKKKQVVLLPGVEKLADFQDDYFLVMVGNQSAVARGLINEQMMWKIDKLVKKKLVGAGVVIAASYYCPHHPDFTGPCPCRKPAPGLILQAIKELKIDPRRSVMIGDKPSDLAAGEKAGLKMGILVKRNGEEWEATVEELEMMRYKTETLDQALDILKEER